MNGMERNARLDDRAGGGWLRQERLPYCWGELPGGGIALGGVGGQLTGDGDDGGMIHDGDDEWWTIRRTTGAGRRAAATDGGASCSDG